MSGSLVLGPVSPYWGSPGELLVILAWCDSSWMQEEVWVGPTTHRSHCSNHLRSCLHFLSLSVKFLLSRQLNLQDLGKKIIWVMVVQGERREGGSGSSL